MRLHELHPAKHEQLSPVAVLSPPMQETGLAVVVVEQSSPEDTNGMENGQAVRQKQTY
jgi:hypothetical protein